MLHLLSTTPCSSLVDFGLRLIRTRCNSIGNIILRLLCGVLGLVGLCLDLLLAWGGRTTEAEEEDEEGDEGDTDGARHLWNERDSLHWALLEQLNEQSSLLLDEEDWVLEEDEVGWGLLVVSGWLSSLLGGLLVGLLDVEGLLLESLGLCLVVSDVDVVEEDVLVH